MKTRILYISIDGLLEPLGYSQILSYLVDSSQECKFFIISLEKKSDITNIKHFNKIKEITKFNNITWKYLQYPKNKFFFLKLTSLIKIFIYSIYYIFKFKINIVHARSYPASFIGLILKYIFHTKLIFDMRGFWIEERIEWNIWKKNNLKYYLLKFIEKKLFINSNVIVSLTNVGARIINEKYLKSQKNKIFVIPTCVKLPDQRNKRNYNKENFILTHLGSIGSRYDFEKFITLHKLLQNYNNVKSFIINKNEHDYIKNLFKKNVIHPKNYEVKYLLPYEVQSTLMFSTLGAFFPIKGFYLNGYFPTKLGEFLACGIPVVTTPINKDVDDIISLNKVGIIINNFDSYTFEKNYKEINKILEDKKISDRCHNIAKKYFSSSIAIKKYLSIYEGL